MYMCKNAKVVGSSPTQRSQSFFEKRAELLCLFVVLCYSF